MQKNAILNRAIRFIFFNPPQKSLAGNTKNQYHPKLKKDAAPVPCAGKSNTHQQIKLVLKLFFIPIKPSKFYFFHKPH